MSRSTSQRLSDLTSAIDAIVAHEARLDEAGVDREEQVRLDAVVRQLAVVGEAASHLPDDLVAAEPDIPWADVRGIRIVLDHGYHRVDPDIVWRTVDRDLGPLRAAAARLAQRLDEPD